VVSKSDTTFFSIIKGELNERVFNKKTEDVIFYLSYPLHWILLTFIKIVIDLR